MALNNSGYIGCQASMADLFANFHIPKTNLVSRNNHGTILKKNFIFPSRDKTIEIPAPKERVPV